MIYIACPYSSVDPTVKRHRVECVTKYASLLIIDNFHFFSPISHSVDIDNMVHGIFHSSNSNDLRDRWLAIDLEIMKKCATEVHVLMMDGWRESYGVQYEIEYAKHRGIQVLYYGVRFVSGEFSFEMHAGEPNQ